MFRVKARLLRLSLSRKLTAIGVLAAAAALTFASAVLLVADVSLERASLVRDLGTITDVAGINSTATISFGDAKAAAETLSALRVNPQIVTAAILLRDGRVFARFDRDPGSPRVMTVEDDAAPNREPWHRFATGSLRLTRPISLRGDVLGAMYVESDLQQIWARVKRYLQILTASLFGALVLAFALSNKLPRVISTPLLPLTEVARGVTRDHQYEVRVERIGSDEIGELIDGFKESGAHLRIVAMTAHAMTDDRERCFAAGMDGYLSKPIDKRMLFAVVEQGSPGRDAPANAFAPPSLDRAAVMERLGGDVDLFADVIGLFLEDCPPRVAAVKAAIDARDADALRAAAHVLKGVAANLSAAGLFDAAQTLERLGAESRFDPAEAAWRRLSVEAANVMEALRPIGQRG